MNADLKSLYADVLEQVDPTIALHQLASTGYFAFAQTTPIVVLAFGKAARRMAAAVQHELPNATMRGLVVPPELDAAPLPPFEILPGGHPLPTAGSLRAGQRALALARSVRPDETLLFLISGGGSAMLELPADDRVTLEELRALNQALVGSGASIAEINTVRRHLSAIKGGRLAMAGGAAQMQRTIVISDIPDDAPLAALASGPTVPDRTTLADCCTVLDRFGLWPKVPEVLRQRIHEHSLPPPMPVDHALAQHAEVLRLLGERDARDAATVAAARFASIVDNQCNVDDWHYEQAAEHLLQRLEQLHQTHRQQTVAIVTTGELSVPLPASPGIGGRNLQFLLACALRIQGQKIRVLSCGTDGIDGNATAAGAIVDGTTIARANARGFDAADHLLRCDAFPLLDALGDCLKPGNTGTNVRDIRVLVREP